MFVSIFIPQYPFPTLEILAKRVISKFKPGKATVACFDGDGFARKKIHNIVLNIMVR